MIRLKAFRHSPWVVLITLLIWSCDNEPVEFPLIQRPVSISILPQPNFSNEFVEDRPVEVVINIDNQRIDFKSYSIRVLRAISREPVQFMEGELQPVTDQFFVTLAPFKADLYSIIVTVTDVNDFQSANSTFLNIPPQAFQEDYERIWFLGASTQWQEPILLAQTDDHIWGSNCVPLIEGGQFLLTSDLGFRECHWGGNITLSGIDQAVPIPITCDTVNYTRLEKTIVNSELPSGNYQLEFDDITNELTISLVDNCADQQDDSAPFQLEGTAVNFINPGADYLKRSNRGWELIHYFKEGSFHFTDTQNTVYGDGGNGNLQASGNPINVISGLQYIYVDPETLEFQIQAINTVSVVGDLDWSADMTMEQDPLLPWIYHIRNIALESGSIRFRANESWDISLGDADEDGLLTFNGGNIPVSGGRFDITVNLIDHSYRITPL